MTTTSKRQRQREGRVARMEAERKAAIKAARRRRIITAVLVAVLIVGLMAVLAFFRGDDDDGGDGDEGASSTTTAETPSTTAPEKPEVTVPEGPAPTTLQTTDITVGDGPEARAGSAVEVHYVGKVFASGEEFESSYESEPIAFTIGSGQVIPGWDQGVAGMRVGGRRQLVIPPDLAYGDQAQGDIPPNSTLVFVIDLMSVDETPAEATPGG